MLSRLVLRVQQVLGSQCGELSLDKAGALVNKPGVFFFDVNGPERYAQGHIPGARNLGRGKLDPDALPTKNATLIFYCGGPT